MTDSSSTVRKTTDTAPIRRGIGYWDEEGSVWDAMIALAECGAVDLSGEISQKTPESGCIKVA